MLKIEDGRLSFYQWDLNQRLVIDNPSIIEVHYTNALTSPALVCEVYEENAIRYANVPNILLQTDWTIKAYGCCDDYVIEAETFIVNTREKPADYVYTETEIKRYDDLEKRIDNLEQGGSGGVDLTNYYTKKETDTALAGKLDNAPDTWPVWTANQQAAARERMGIGDYELIEEITLTEDVKSVFRTAEPNGESYKFKSIYFVLEIPAGVSHANTWWFIKNGSNILAYPNRSIVNKTKVSYYQCGAIREKGLITGWFDNSNTLSTETGGLTQICKNHSIFTDLPITEIEIRASDTFVSGEIFRIYGVRA